MVLINELILVRYRSDQH